jgi:hypothetical protein
MVHCLDLRYGVKSSFVAAVRDLVIVDAKTLGDAWIIIQWGVPCKILFKTK